MEGSGLGPELRDRLQATLGGTHTIERELGGGGMSRIFVAHDARLGRRIVVKVLHPELTAVLSSSRFEREVTLAAQLQHPHIVPLLSAGDVDGLPYYTMPLIEGETLRHRVARDGRLPIADAVRLIREVADALTYAHARGVVHRDLKPANILLSGGHAVVADFGVAKALASATESGIATPAGTVTGVGLAVGTPAYMAPEQALGDPATDHRADLYALGVIAYELLSGAPPFVRQTPQELVAAHVTEAPRPLVEHRPEVPPALAALVTRLLAKSPKDRPASAEAVVGDLDSILPLLTPTATEADPALRAAPRIDARPRPARWQLLVGAAVMVFAVVGGSIYVRERHRASETSGVVRARSDSTATRIAVLPFENLGPAADTDFAAGLAEAIRGQLATLPALTVIDGRSSMPYRGSTKPLREIGRELGVAYVLQATLQWAKGPDGVRRLQVRPALVAVADAATRWSAPYTAEPTDVFRVQAEIAAQVASALDIALDERQRVELTTAPTPNPAAYDQYLRGLDLEQQAILRGSGEAAVEAAFERAVSMDPRFGAAWARLATARINRWVVEAQHDAAALSRLRAAVDSSRRLAPGQAETHLASGRLAYNVDRDYPRARDELRAAARDRPGDAVLLTEVGGFLVFTPGSMNEGLSALARAAQLDPHQLPTNAAYSFISAGRFREAISYADRIIALAPDEVGGYSVKAQALLASGAGVPAARRVLDSAVAHAGSRAVSLDLLYWWNDAAAIFGEPYEQQLEALSLTETNPASSVNTAAYYLTKALHALHTGRRSMAIAFCDSTAVTLAEWDRDPNGAVARSAGNAVSPLGWLAAAHACRGQVASRRRVEDALRDVLMHPHSLFDDAAVPRFLANASVFAGERDSAVAQLERAVRPPAFVWPGWLRVDPFYASLRGHPGFEAILARTPQ